MTISADQPSEDLDPTNDPPVAGHEEGKQAPFPPEWPGDPYAGHHRSCGVRVKIPCTCGQEAYLAQKAILDEANKFGRVADLPVAAEYLHQLLHLPEDVHVIGCYSEHTPGGSINFVFVLEAFSDSEFPSGRVTAHFTTHYNADGNPTSTSFDGWEDIS